MLPIDLSLLLLYTQLCTVYDLLFESNSNNPSLGCHEEVRLIGLFTKLESLQICCSIGVKREII